MDAIFSSKLYKISSRKKKISTAIQNPVNIELVKQLKSYIDEPDDITDALEEEDKKVQVEQDKYSRDNDSRSVEKSESGVETDKSATPEVTPLSRFHSPGSEFENPESDDESEETKEDETSKSEEDSEDESEKEGEKVQTSVALNSEPVKASCCDKVRIDAEIIKGTLNSRESTKGVSRIAHKDNELWIYYQDKINLNSIMEPVIELLNASDFSHLEFNRLARSSNAIVFEVTCIPESVEPIIKE